MHCSKNFQKKAPDGSHNQDWPTHLKKVQQTNILNQEPAQA